ncbi:MAG TPA: MMPL family transporter [Candidatus Omnitrophota bacterium]|nr:MMPL family transporter [Candidatus Omnitrophota bacterium]
MFRKLAEFIDRYRWPMLLAMVASLFIMGNAVLRLKVDPSIEPLFIKKSADYKYYQEYREKYGSDQMIAVAMSTDDLFTDVNFGILKRVTEGIQSFDRVERVISLANAQDIRHKFLGVKTELAFKEVEEGDKSVAEMRKSILSNELYLSNIVSRDGKIANIVVYLKTDEDSAANGVFIKQLREYLDDFERPGLKFYMAGAPVEQYEFIHLIHRDQMVFIPIITVILVLVTFFIYRSFACMFLSMSIVFTTLIWTLGTIALLGQELNLMTSLLAPVIMIVAVLNATYLINLFFEIRPHHASLRETVLLTIQQLGLPCLLTHFTAILGFASLALNRIPAIQSFGLYAALGTFYAYFVEIILTILLLPILPYRPKKVDAFDESHFFNRVLIKFIENLESRWQWLILLVTAVIIFFSVQGVKRIEVDTNIVKQMKPELPLAIATKFIDDNLTGVYSLGFVLRRKDGELMVDPKTLRKLDEFKTYMESEDGIAKVNSITTLVKKINEARADDDDKYEIPDNPGLLKLYFKGMAQSGDPELWKMISPDFREVRIEARMRAIGTTKGAALEDRIRAYLDERLSDFFEYKLTGNVVLLGKISKSLLHEQARSFIFAFLSILIVITLIFRSVKLGLLAAIPNLFPILAVYGFMGYTGIELSTATAMIASIVLGLVVDASIQFIYRFEKEFHHRFHYLQSLHHTYRNVGQSMVLSTLILCLGFAASVCASFRITVHFGVLTSLTIFLALLCSLLVLPIFLVMLKPFGPQRLFKRKLRGGDSFHEHKVLSHHDDI